MYATLKLKQAFVKMFFYLVNNYLACYKNEESCSEAGNLAEAMFNFEYYLSLADDENRSFMTEFCKTQGFCNFIERSCRANKEHDLFFFKEGIKLCSEKRENVLAAQMKAIEEQALQNLSLIHICRCRRAI
eukprot:TRINITY_DN3019_c0_g2_i2.p2 TRINITY_DN3019_c0_g2~~TRINITY_DN3019_c0_g2_i2.p2  ORF type:complete len:131 (-),score=39.51 TRINITY_DN3019_c0_g2_i2:47-439(-)